MLGLAVKDGVAFEQISVSAIVGIPFLGPKTPKSPQAEHLTFTLEPSLQPMRARLRGPQGTFSGVRTGSLGAGSVAVGVGLGTTTGFGMVSGISMGSDPG